MSEYLVDFGDTSSAFVGLAMAEAEAHGAKVRERIVRCRDCKQARPEPPSNKRSRKDYQGGYWCDLLSETIGWLCEPDGYCAWGVRRET